MENKRFRFGPILLTTTLTTNLLNPGTSSGGVNSGTPNHRILLNHIRVVNVHASATGKVSLWLGATAANTLGTEVGWRNFPIPAGTIADWYPDNLLLDITDFLVGGADTASCLTIEGEGEIGIA